LRRTSQQGRRQHQGIEEGDEQRKAPHRDKQQTIARKANPAKCNKRNRDYYATNDGFRQRRAAKVTEKRTKKRHATEESIRQAAKAVRDLGEPLTQADLLQQVYKARPDTRNAQVLLDDRFTIFHVTQVAPHELKPAGLLERRDSHRRDENSTERQLKSFEQVWGTPVSLVKACYGFANLHGGSKVIFTKALHVYAITESHRQYETFYQHTIRGKNGNINDAPKHGEHFVCSREHITVGESDPGVVVLRIPWISDGEPDFENLEVLYCNAGE
jgi:hypothetical protein